jgi:glutaredoxin
VGGPQTTIAAKEVAAEIGAMKKAKVVMYTRPGCHLCDEARASIQAAGCDDELTLEEINIDLDPELRERYGDHIPVVLINGTKAFKHRVDPREFKRKLRRLTRDS